MIPFQKIFALLIRTFSGPMLRYFRQKQKLQESSLLGRFFIDFGRKTLSIEHWINYRMLKMLTPKRHKHVSEQFLLEKGVETFYQILFYMIVLGLPFWELYKGSQSSIEKQRTLQKRLKGLQSTLNKVNTKIDKVHGMMLNRQLEREERKEKHQKEMTNYKPLEELEKDEDDEQPEKHVDLEQILEHAVEVIADEFQDALDELPYVEDDPIDLQEGNNQIDSIDSDTLDEVDGGTDNLEDENVLFSSDQLENTIDLTGTDCEGILQAGDT